MIYTSCVALAQTDMKKLIAYSSVAHMGVVTIGIFTFNLQGISGALFQMLSHGVVSAALFLCVGVIYDRMHTREIARYGGLADRMPAYACMFMLFTMASVGLPGTAGFVGEFLVLVGALKVNFWLALLGCSGMILGAAYMLYLYRRVIFGTPHPRRPARHPRPFAARGRRVRAAGAADPVDGHLPLQLHRLLGRAASAPWWSITTRHSRPRCSSPEVLPNELDARFAEIVLSVCGMAHPAVRRAAETRQFFPLLHADARRLPARRRAGRSAATGGRASTGMFPVDRFSRFAKLLMLAGAGSAFSRSITTRRQSPGSNIPC